MVHFDYRIYLSKSFNLISDVDPDSFGSVDPDPDPYSDCGPDPGVQNKGKIKSLTNYFFLSRRNRNKK